jgi:hypothetical protein
LALLNNEVVLACIVSQLCLDTPHDFIDALVKLLQQLTRVERDFRLMSVFDQLVIVRLLSLEKLGNFRVNLNEFSVIFAIVKVYKHV